MRKLIVLSFMSLDGIIQAPGGPEEDTSGGFRYGGWVFPFFDDVLGSEMGRQIGSDFDLLLGRMTYDIFASYWPLQDPSQNQTAAAFNKAKKYVVSKTLKMADWSNSLIIRNNVVEEIIKIKDSSGPDIQVHGSANLIQTLWEHDLVDELWLKIFPVVLGGGKKLFVNGKFAGRFELYESKTTPSSVLIAYYRRSGAIQTGSF